MLACLLACFLAACLLASGFWLFACLLACLLVGLPALSFNLILDFSPLQSTRRLSVRSDPLAVSVAPALMPASYAAAHAEPKEHRADRTQFLHTIAYSGVGAPQVHKSTSNSCSMAHTSKFQAYRDAVSPLSEPSSMSTRMDSASQHSKPSQATEKATQWTCLHKQHIGQSITREPPAPVIQTSSLTLCVPTFLPTPSCEFLNAPQMIKRQQYLVNSHQAFADAAPHWLFFLSSLGKGR